MIEIQTDTQIERITCATPGIRNHNGTPKPVATLTPEGIWVFCRWSREMEFVTSERCQQFWQSAATEHDGKLDKDGGYHAYHTLGRDQKTPFVVVEGRPGPYTCEDMIQMSPAQALSLLAWLQQEKQQLQLLAKEHQP